MSKKSNFDRGNKKENSIKSLIPSFETLISPLKDGNNPKASLMWRGKVVMSWEDFLNCFQTLKYDVWWQKVWGILPIVLILISVITFWIIVSAPTTVFFQ